MQRSRSITIDSQQMSGAMMADANHLADARGITQRVDYWQAAEVVYRRWSRVLVRKSGQVMIKYDLTWLLAEEINMALADLHIVGFHGGEVIPQRLTKYLRDVARNVADL